MNKHVHRLVFDHHRGMRVPAHEHARSARKAAGGQTRAVALGALALIASLGDAQAQMRSEGAVAGVAVSRAQGATAVAPAARPVSALVRDALANPRANLPTYSAGNWALNTGSYQDPALSPDGKVMTLVQKGGTIVLNWDSFDIGQGYTMRFEQPTGGRALNRVANLTPSVIDGVLSANGEVMLENTAGVIFGSNARVNTHSFVATALKITSEVFESGIRGFRKGEASFGGDNSAVNGFISVEKGAEIRTIGAGGDVILVAPRVVNQGLIETPQGQAIMAAGKTVYLYAPLDAAQRGLLVSIDNFDEAALAEAPDLGSVENVRLDGDTRSGTVRADKGTINLVGAAIRQKGQLTATTAVKGQNGAIFLTAMKDTVSADATDVFSGSRSEGMDYSGDTVRIAQNTGTVELGQGSITEVLPSVDGLVLSPEQIAAGKIGVSPDEIMRVRDKPTAPKAISATATAEEKATYDRAKAAYEADLKVYETLLQQASDTFYRSRIDIIGKEITLRSGSLVQAPAGEVNILATDNWSTSSLRTSQGSQAQDGSRLVMEAGAKVDVSGLDNLLLPASRNQLQGRLFSIELADSPLQRDGVVYRAELLADARRRITIGDATGLYNDIRYSAAEYATAGGIVRMQAQGGMLLEKDALIDFSGGQVTYDAGTLVSSLLLRDGALTRIENATKDLRYTDLLSDPTRATADELTRLGLTDAGITAPAVLEAQSVGMSAGVAVMFAPSMAMGATLDGHVTMSEVQRLSADVAGRDTALDPSTGFNMLSDASREVNRPALLKEQPHLYASLKPTAGLLVLGQHGIENSDTKVPESTMVSTIRLSGQALALPAVPTTWTEESWQQALAQMGEGLTVSTELLNSARLAGLSLLAGTVSVGSSETGDHPSIRLASGGSFSADAVAGVQIDGHITSAGGTLTLKSRQADVMLGSQALLDTAGTVRDERISAAPANEGVARNGGTVTLDAARHVSLAAGSEIDVSGGAWRSASGTLVQGKAGSISLEINKLYTDKSQSPEGRLTADGVLSGYDFSAGGSLKLTGLPSVVIGGTRDDAFSIGTNLFADRGFGKLEVVSIGHIDVLAGTQIKPQLVNMVAVAPRLAGFTALPYELTVLEAGRRQGNTLILSAKTEPAQGASATFGLENGANLTIGAGALLDLGIGGRIDLSAGGSIDMAGTLRANAGNVSLRILGNRGATVGGNDIETGGYLPNQRIHLMAGSSIDVSGIVKSYIADGDTALFLGQAAREVGEVLGGGTVTLGGSDGTATRGRLIMDPTATISIAGASGYLDRGILPGKTLISAGAGTLNIMSTDGFALLGTVDATARHPSVNGGTINIALSQEGLEDRTDPSVPYPKDDETGQRTIRITGTQSQAQALSNDGQKFAEGVVSAELLNGSGFDRIQLRADESIQLNTGANLVADNSRTRLQSVVLNAAVIDVADGAGHVIQAHHVAMGPQARLGDSRPAALPNVDAASKRAAAGHLGGEGSLTVQAGLIEVFGDTGVLGVNDVTLAATLSRAAGTALERTDGEIRFIGQPGSSNKAEDALKAQFSFSGNLTLQAGQVYASTMSRVLIQGFDGLGDLTNSKLTISAPGKGSTSQTPLSALASLKLQADEIELDGVIRQPFGTIDIQAGKLTLTDHAQLSVSGDGIKVPVGSTVDQTKWVYGTQGTVDTKGTAVTLDPSATGSTVIDLTSLPINKQIILNGDTLTLSSQSAVDAHAGGDILAWEFKKGVGGSQDTFLRQGVFAIVPNYSYDFAPYDTEIRATSEKLGSAPKAGDQVTITTDNGVLRAGTYTLMDARYGILPGAVLVSATTLGVTAPLPVAVQNDDGSVIVSGYRTRTGTAQNGGGDQRLALTLEPEATFRKKSEIILTSGNAYQDMLAERRGESLVRPGDAGRVSLISTSAFDWAAKFNLAGNEKEGLSAGQFDLAMPDMVVQADETQDVPAGAKRVSMAQLNALGADSILLGGVRTNNPDGSVSVTRKASSVTFQADIGTDGKPLTGTPEKPLNVLSTRGELMAVAQDKVTVESGLTIASTGTDTGATRHYALQGDGAALQVGNLSRTTISAKGVTEAAKGDLAIGNDSADGRVVLRGNSVQLDATNVLSMAGSTDLATRSLGLGGKRVSVGAAPDTALDPSTLSVSGKLLTAANGADRLQLRSYTSIDFHNSAQLGSTQMSQLILDAPQLLGVGTDADTAIVRAREVVLANSSGRTAPTQTVAVNGTDVTKAEEGGSSLLIEARPVMRDGRTGGLTIDASLGDQQAATTGAGQRLGFTQSTLDSSGDIIFKGRGQTTAQGDLTLRAARVTATSTSDQQAKAQGALSIEAGSTGSKTLNESLGAGGKLALSGSTVTQAGLIDIESGRLSLTAEGVNGQSNAITFAKDSKTVVDGRLRQVSDTYAVASGGGQITTEAKRGQIFIDGLLSAKAPQIPKNQSGDNPYAGSITLKAGGANDEQGGQVIIGVNADINLDAASGKGGSLIVDAQRLALNDAAKAAAAKAVEENAKVAQTGLDKLLDISSNVSSDTAHRLVDIRLRGADEVKDGVVINNVMALNTSVKAAMVSLTSDGGQLKLGNEAKIDATVPQGGIVQLQARDNLILSDKAEVLAQSTREGANGGDILLSSTEGSVLFGQATVKADSANDALDGRIVIRAGQKVDANGNYTGVKVGRLADDDGTPLAPPPTLQAGQIEVEAVRVYKDDATDPSSWHTELVAQQGTETVWGLETLISHAEQLTTSENKDMILDQIGLKGRSEAHVKAGIELQSLGDLSISEITLNEMRSGGEAVTLTIRSAKDIHVNGTVSDGFKGTATVMEAQAGDAASLRFVAGADITSAKLSATKDDATQGHLTLAGGKYIRTTAGSIDIHTSGDVRLMAPTLTTTSAIYVAGRESLLAGFTPYGNARFTERGGRLTVGAGGNVGSYFIDKGALTVQQVAQMTGNYFFHGGRLVPVAWWTGLNAFKQGFGSFGGGNISVTAGGNVSNVAVASPTNARKIGTKLHELNGGDIEVLAGGDIDGGVYFLGRGHGRLSAGGSLNRGADKVDRSLAEGQPVLPGANVVFEPGAMLGLMAGQWDVTAFTDLNLAYVFNPTILPFRTNNSNPALNVGNISNSASGLNSSNASVYFTYASDAGVSLSALQGNVNWETNTQSINLMHRVLNQTASAAGGTSISLNGSLDSTVGLVASVAPPVVSITSLQGNVVINTAGRAVSKSGDTVESTSKSAYPLYVMPSAKSDVKIFADQDLVLQGNLQLIDISQAALGLPSTDAPMLLVGATTTPSNNFQWFNTSLLPTGSGKAPAGIRLSDALETLTANPISDVDQAGNDRIVHLHAGRDIIFDTLTEDGVTALPFMRSNRPMELTAGRDLVNPAVIGQNFTEDDLTRIAAGRDIIGGVTTSSKIVLGGPGALRVEAGRDIELNQSLGVVAVANQINTALPEQSAKITVSAGNARTVDIGQMLDRYRNDPALRSAMNTALDKSKLPPPENAKSWAEVGLEATVAAFQSLTDDHQTEALQKYLNAVFVARYLPSQAGQPDAYYRSEAFIRLKQEALWQQVITLAGQAVAIATSSDAQEEAGRAAQRKALFDQAANVVDLAGFGSSFKRTGNINLSNAKVHNLGVGGGVASGQVDDGQGGIDLIAAGQITAGLPSAATSPAGFINFQGGSFRSLSNGDFLAGDQKVIVVGRGNLYIYTTDGDIDSGKGSNTSAAQPKPTRVFDAQTGRVIAMGQPPTSGSGFQTVEPPSGVDTVIGLYAPNGEIRALDAYIQGGKVELAAPKVIGADNIANATGTTPPPPPAVSLSLTPKVADTAAGVAQVAASAEMRGESASSVLTVELLGFGGEAPEPVPMSTPRDTQGEGKPEQERKARKDRDAS
jgi:filamentous hemagglutinin family protein